MSDKIPYVDGTILSCSLRKYQSLIQKINPRLIICDKIKIVFGLMVRLPT